MLKRTVLTWALIAIHIIVQQFTLLTNMGIMAISSWLELMLLAIDYFSVRTLETIDLYSRV